MVSKMNSMGLFSNDLPAPKLLPLATDPIDDLQTKIEDVSIKEESLNVSSGSNDGKAKKAGAKKKE